MNLDEFKTNQLIWDYANKRIYEDFSASGGDVNGRALDVRVVNKSEAVNVSGASLHLAWKHPHNGTKGLDAFTIEDASNGMFHLTYTTGMQSNDGVLDASLVLISESIQIESLPFKLTVYPSLVDADSAQSENSFSTLTEAINNVMGFEGRIATLEDVPEIPPTRITKKANALSDLAQVSDDFIQCGDVVVTAGYFNRGDGGHAMYVMEETSDPEDGGSVITINNGLQAHLLPVNSVNYKQFGAVGNGSNDDGVQIKKAHEYANKMDIPVINTWGEYWIKETRNIPVMTNVDHGNTIIHIDESVAPYSNSQPFNVMSEHEPFTISSSLFPGILADMKQDTEPLLEELADYAGHFMKIIDSTREVYKRNGETGQSMYDIFYIGEGGQVIGEVTWPDWDNITEIELRKCDESYLNIKGGTFLLSGDPQTTVDAHYVWSGFFIGRSHVVIEQQYVGYPEGVQDNLDTLTSPVRGFHYLENVYDVTIDTMRNVPRKTNNHGSYGLNGYNAINVTLRNITAEGGSDSWGYVATNYFKNVVVENCKLNRYDAHIRTWNLDIINSRIGREGLMLGGGGRLNINNTSVYRRDFVYMRADYGSSWDGDITIVDCKMVVLASWWDNVIVAFNPGAYDYGFSQVFGRTIKIHNFTFDFLGDEGNTARTQIVEFDHPDELPQGRPQYPTEIHAENIRTLGREQGIQLIMLKKPNRYYSPIAGGWDSVSGTIKTNVLYTFKNIKQDDRVTSPHTETDGSYWSLVPGADWYLDDHCLYPKIVIDNCSPLKLAPTSSLVDFTIRDCEIRSIHSWDARGERSRFSFVNCEFNPDILDGAWEPYQFNKNYTSLIGCTLHSIKINGVEDLARSLTDLPFFTADSALQYMTTAGDHAGTRVSNPLATYMYSISRKNAESLLRRLSSYTEYSGHSKMGIDSGPTTERISGSGMPDGYTYFDTTLKQPVYWDSASWSYYDAMGNKV